MVEENSHFLLPYFSATLSAIGIPDNELSGVFFLLTFENQNSLTAFIFITWKIDKMYTRFLGRYLPPLQM
jgi:hypothetical protein